MDKKVILRKGKEESLQRFHPWIFSGAVMYLEGNPEEGDLVEVVNSQGSFLCKGHWQVGSIAVRVLTFDDEPVDDDFWKRRLSSALAVRQAIGLADSSQGNTYRLIHGEGDNLPGLVIDIYGKTAVMQAHSVGMHVNRHLIASSLASVMGPRLDSIYYKSETTLPIKAVVDGGNGFLLGDSHTDIATENGLNFHIDWLKGQKTGFFIDQRENRSLLERYARGRKVLNMFCYTGGFSVYALRGGATLVHSVDSSSKAVELVRSNVELNFPGDTRHEAYAEDAFRFLDEMTIPYDLVVLDPPAFAKHRDAIKNALRGYTKLNAKAMEKLAPNSILFTFSCSQAVSKEQFRTAVFTAATLAQRRVRILHQLHQPADHPVNIYQPEGEYLKGLVLYVE